MGGKTEKQVFYLLSLALSFDQNEPAVVHLRLKLIWIDHQNTFYRTELQTDGFDHKRKRILYSLSSSSVT